MIEAVIFDFDGTLVDFKDSDIACLKHLLLKSGAKVNPKSSFIDRAVLHIMNFHELVDSGKVDPLTLHQYRLSRTFRDFGIEWKEAYVDEYKVHLLENTNPYPGVIKLLSELDDSVKLGILTNAYDSVMQKKRIRAAGLIDYFQCIQISGEEKYAKPNPKAFSLICNRLGIRPDKCVFIGNSPKYDIDGARRTEMKTVLIQKEIANLQVKPDYVVRSVLELAPILKKLGA